MDLKSLDDNDFMFDDNFNADKLLEYIEKNKDKVNKSQKTIAEMFEILGVKDERKWQTTI